jgi:hypothetical protein
MCRLSEAQVLPAYEPADRPVSGLHPTSGSAIAGTLRLVSRDDCLELRPVWLAKAAVLAHHDGPGRPMGVNFGKTSAGCAPVHPGH